MANESRQAQVGRNRRWTSFDDAIYGINQRLVGMRRKQLIQIVLDADCFTNTNCGWATYAIRGLVKELAADEFRRREGIKAERIAAKKSRKK
jgi:hypothetical protein